MFLGIVTAAGMYAQEPAGPYGKFYGPLASGAWTTKTPSAYSQVLAQKFTAPMAIPPQPATPVCSVPLLEAQIPKDVDFKMKQLAPHTDKLAPMPQATVPAPACEPKSQR